MRKDLASCPPHTHTHTPLLHAQVPFVAGSYSAVAYDTTGAVVATHIRNTTGAAVALVASIRDMVGTTLYSGCNDYGLVEVKVVDINGQVVPDASNVVTLSISGTPSAYIEGSGNGDPAGDYNNKLPAHPAYHGLMLGVIAAGDDVGTITITATATGLTSSSVKMPVVDGTGLATKWCPNYPKW